MVSSKSKAKKGRFFGFTSGVTFRITTTNAGHRHKWRADMPQTSVNDNHNHRINLRRRLALPNRRGAHMHRLL